MINRSNRDFVNVLIMLILKYCKPISSLPNPNGPLSEKISSKAIELANAEVEKISHLSKEQASEKTRGPRPNKYLILSPAQRFEVGKRAAEHGVTSSLRYFSKKYPQLPLKETTVRRLKNLYRLETKRASKNPSSLEEPLGEVHELSRKKTGRPLLLGKDLDTQVQEYLKGLRKCGMPINTSIVIASARGIVMNKNANLLVSNGGGIDLTKDWAKYLLKRMGFVKRKACSKSKVNVEKFQELKEDFLLEIKNTVVMDEIPEDLIINFDQTGLNYVPVTSWTMEEAGARRVEVVAKDDKRQLTAVFAGSLSGNFLPPQLIYEGKTERCHPQFKFPAGWHITNSVNHWSNEDTMREYVEMIIIPYVDEKRKDLKLAHDYPALVIFDNFKAQCTYSVLTLLDNHNINVTLIPPNCTDRLQPLDLSINKPAKDFLRTQFQEWYAQELSTILQAQSEGTGTDTSVDLKLSVIKPIAAGWIVSLYDYIKRKPELVKNGFKEAGITNYLSSNI